MQQFNLDFPKFPALIEICGFWAEFERFHARIKSCPANFAVLRRIPQKGKEAGHVPGLSLAGTLPQVLRQTAYWSGLSVLVADPAGLKRITPLASAKKKRLPVCPGDAGLPSNVKPILVVPPLIG